MDNILKQRILGIIVLFALLGICLSVLLHHNNRSLAANTVITNSLPPPAPASATNNVATQATTGNSVFNLPANAPIATANNSAASTSALNTSNNPQTSAATTGTITTPATSSTNTNNVMQQPSPAMANEATPAATSAPAPAANTTASTYNPSAAALANAQDDDEVPPPATTAAATTSANSNSTAAPVSAFNGPVSKRATVSTNPTQQNSTAAVSDDATTLAPATPVTHTKKPVHQNTATLAASHTADKSSASKTTSNSAQHWLVQAGSFNNPANAQKLIKQLSAQGFTATTKKIQTAKGPMTSVIVGGNNLSLDKAKALRTKLSQSLHISAILKPHTNNTSSSTTAVAIPADD